MLDEETADPMGKLISFENSSIQHDNLALCPWPTAVLISILLTAKRSHVEKTDLLHAGSQNRRLAFYKVPSSIVGVSVSRTREFALRRSKKKMSEKPEEGHPSARTALTNPNALAKDSMSDGTVPNAANGVPVKASRTFTVAPTTEW